MIPEGMTALNIVKMAGARRSTLDIARGRMVVVTCFFIIAYILVAARVFDLSVIQGELRRGDAAEAAAPAQAAAVAAVRADITDRNGVLLATSLETASLYADPALVSDPVRVAKDLARALPSLSYGDALQKLQRKGRFVWLARNLTPAEQYEILKLGYPGLDFKTEYRRIYPQERLTAHIAGYTDLDGHGLGGVERSFDRLLASGGRPLALTVDIRLQHILRRELAAAVSEFSAKGGAGTIMDVRTGEVLAAVSLPDFDPHNPGAEGSGPLFNRLTQGVYEMGSTFKIFSTAAFLETKGAPLDTVFDATKPIKRGRFSIADYHPEKRPLTVPEIFMYSSNIGAALEGEAVGAEDLEAFYGSLGLLDAPEIEIGETGRPLVPSPWRDIDTLTAAFGHGIAVTPLQMVTAAASIAGGGGLLRPALVRDAASRPEKAAKARIVSPQTAHRMRQMMRLVVTDGTGRAADVPGYNVGGKTGTAEKNAPGGGYDRGRLLSSFIGFFPVDEPRYAVFVMVDEPKGTKKSFGYATGGWVAAPAVGRIVAAMGPLLGMKPQGAEREKEFAASLRQYLRKDGGTEKNLVSY